ncbi:MAG: isoprenylcysteine carboxylmethyltransferase family protein [Pyrinomonadaceae bacterium]
MDLFRYYLLIHFAAFIGLAFIFSSYRTWKRTGVFPYKFSNTDSAHDFIGLVYRIIMVAMAATMLINALWPGLYEYLAPVRWLEHDYVRAAAVTILIGSLVFIVVAQVHMSDSWRIGIDTNEKTPLVRRGLFGFSRNPIFVGMRLTLFGFFLALPNAVTLATFLTADALIQVQVRLEEEFLSSSHGEDYAAYCRGVRRWI